MKKFTYHIFYLLFCIYLILPVIYSNSSVYFHRSSTSYATSYGNNYQTSSTSTSSSSSTSTSSTYSTSSTMTSINIILPSKYYDSFAEKIDHFSSTNEIDITITKMSNDDEYYSYITNYFEQQSYYQTNYNSLFIPSSFLPNLLHYLDAFDEPIITDEYESLDYNTEFGPIEFGVMLTSEFNVLYYRSDFVNHTISTWDDVIEILGANIDKDFNGDFVVDSPSCIPVDKENYLYNLFYSILSPMMQTEGTTEGIFFEKDGFLPLIKNFAFQLATETMNSIVNPSISTIGDARKKFLNGECIILIDSVNFGKEIVNSSQTNFKNKVEVIATPGSRNVYYRDQGQLQYCSPTSSSCITNQITNITYNFAPFIQSSLIGTLSKFNSAEEKETCLKLYEYLTDTFESSIDVVIENNIAPYRPSQLVSPSWQDSDLNKLKGYTNAINETLSNHNVAVDLRIPHNRDFATSLVDSLMKYLQDKYFDPYQTADSVYSDWNQIIADNPDVNFQRFYIISYLLDFEFSTSSSFYDPADEEGFSGGVLAAIISIPIVGTALLLLLIFCIIFLLLFIVYTNIRKKQMDENYEPAWAIDFDEIELKRKIGAGSFGDVYQGVYRGTNVAVKIPREKISDKAQFIKFFDEIAIMRDLRHPNVLLFMGARIQSPNQCIVTEYMPRGSLYDILHDDSIVLDWMLIQTMALDAAQGMDFLHSASPPILHRDFKSPNLLVDKKWNLKVADFGLTKFQKSLNTSDHSPMGSILWTAPEVLQDPENYTKKSDVYSYGIVLWELLTRSDPYQGMNPMYVALAVMEDGLRPSVPPNWHGDIVKLLNDCWHSDPYVRPSFSEIRERLENMELPFEQSNGQGHFSVSPFASKFYPSANSNLPPPKGIITFLFTDIKGYSSLWEENPTAMHKSIQIHNQIIRFVISEYNGYEVKSESDSFMVAFQEAESAIIAATSIHEELMKAPWPKALLRTHSTHDQRDNDGKLIFRGLRLRIGINSGVAYSTTDIVTRRADYFGNSVNRAAQITGMCEGGEILLTPSTVKQLGDVDSLAIAPYVHFSKSHLTIGSKNKPIYRVLPLPLMKRIDYFHLLWNEKQGRNNDNDRHHHNNNGNNNHDHLVKTKSKTEVNLGKKIMRIENGGKEMSGQQWIIDFDEIQLGKKIGTGNFGEVYKGKWKGSDVAVKKFFKQQASEQLLLELRKESVIMSQLRHPNILLFLGACTVAPNLCIVTEFLKFGSVAGILHNKSLTLPFLQRIKYLKGAARGMCYLHGCKPPFIHRDLTTYNLLVGDNDNVKIGDFGLSRIKESNATMTLCGTAAWTAPEILQGLDYSEKSDIYSFGIIMWECYTRRIPFKGMDMIKISKLVTKGARPAIPSNCPDSYQQLMTGCWQTNPENRPTFDTILSQLKEIYRNFRSSKSHEE